MEVLEEQLINYQTEIGLVVEAEAVDLVALVDLVELMLEMVEMLTKMEVMLLLDLEAEAEDLLIQ